MDPVPWIILGVVVLSVVVLILLARRKAWNSDGSDDERRPKAPR